MTKPLNLVGQRFGRLIVVSRAENSPDGRTRWNCRCDCGRTIVVIGKDLRSGNTKSCGCFKIEQTRERTIVHGMTGTRPHRIWCGVIQRCTDLHCKIYPYYGGRGIKVCERWLTFENFWEDMKEGYADDLTLERIDPDGDYCPENCCWADRKKQANNKRNNLVYTIEGKTQTLKQHVEDPEINVHELEYRTVWSRVKCSEWPAEKALFTPPRGKRKKATSSP